MFEAPSPSLTRSSPFLLPHLAPLAAGLLLVACGGGDDPTTPGTDEPQPAQIVVSPQTVAFTALGEIVTLSAEVRDGDGNVMTSTSVEWSTLDASVATVDAGGVVEAVGAGSTEARATAGSATGSAEIEVSQEPAALVVSPEADTLLVNDTLRLTALVEDANGFEVADAAVTWTSTDASVLSVDADGLVKGQAAGAASVSASVEDLEDTVALTTLGVEVTLDSDAVTVAPGAIATLQAAATDDLGREISSADFTWTSSDEGVATVDAGGTVSGVGEGEAVVAASFLGVADSATVTVQSTELSTGEDSALNLSRDGAVAGFVAGIDGGATLQSELDDVGDALAGGGFADGQERARGAPHTGGPGAGRGFGREENPAHGAGTGGGRHGAGPALSCRPARASHRSRARPPFPTASGAPSSR